MKTVNPWICKHCDVHNKEENIYCSACKRKKGGR